MAHTQSAFPVSPDAISGRGFVQPQQHTHQHRPRSIGEREEHIEGRFVRISTHELCLAWWLHIAGHITRRQLRVWFAAHEMLERRRYSDPHHGPERPLYRLRELQTLVGGRGSDRAAAGLRADIRHLHRLGLVSIQQHSIVFARSVEQINVEDLTSFWSMWHNIQNKRRTVPVPRRTLRALAAGFSRGVTGVMIALMIRSLFWHKQSGDFRVDGRTKGSWIAEVFGISRRGVTDARLKLTELGWLTPIACSQIELNRWGARDRINTEWVEADTTERAVGGGSRKTINLPTSTAPATMQPHTHTTAQPTLNLPSLTPNLTVNLPVLI